MNSPIQQQSILEFRGISKHFVAGGERNIVLQDVTASVRRREFVAVVGASGCGKSTLIRIAAGLEQASAGSVVIEGEAVSAPGPERGMVFQQFSLFPWLTVIENVMFGLRSQNNSLASSEQIAAQWVDLVGLSKFSGYYPHQLSGGMQQRVAIARALAPGPRVLLMDEPFAALDPQTRARMQGYLLEIWRNVDITILFVTHDLEEAVLLADRVLVLIPEPGRLGHSFEIQVERTSEGRDRYDPSFKQAVTAIRDLSTTARDDEPPMDIYRLAHVCKDRL